MAELYPRTGEAVSEATKEVILTELSSTICKALSSPATAAESRPRIAGQGFQRLDTLITSLHASSAGEASVALRVRDSLARPAISALLESEDQESTPEAAVLLASLIRKFGDGAQKGASVLYSCLADTMCWSPSAIFMLPKLVDYLFINA